jgi:hypothetical protein
MKGAYWHEWRRSGRLDAITRVFAVGVLVSTTYNNLTAAIRSQLANKFLTTSQALGLLGDGWAKNPGAGSPVAAAGAGARGEGRGAPGPRPRAPGAGAGGGGCFFVVAGRWPRAQCAVRSAQCCAAAPHPSHLPTPKTQNPKPGPTGRCGGGMFQFFNCLTLLGVCGPPNQGEHNRGSVAPWSASFGPHQHRV